MQEALAYKKLDNKAVQCELCNHFCFIKNNKSGICSSRTNKEGVLKNINYGKLKANNIDPIEKKPLFHFMPGSSSYSIGTYGCNLKCLNCQNWELSQEENTEEKISSLEREDPETIVEVAIMHNCKSISYTYNEPTISFEYYLDVMKIAHQKKLKNIWISNGFINQKYLKMLLPYLDAINVDLKSFEDDFYRKYCGARLEPILENLKILYNEQIHLEICSLIIPGISSDYEMLFNLCNFIAQKLDPDTPWHASKFSALASYGLKQLTDTEDNDIQNAYEAGKQAGLNFIYVGNMPGDQKENTYCPECGELCIRRFAYRIERFDVKGLCPKCSRYLGIL